MLGHASRSDLGGKVVFNSIFDFEIPPIDLCSNWATLMPYNSRAVRSPKLKRDQVIQFAYWRDVAAVEYNSDASGHCSRSSPNSAGRNGEFRKTFTKIDAARQTFDRRLPSFGRNTWNVTLRAPNAGPGSGGR
jgi:hypothetical protein